MTPILLLPLLLDAVTCSHKKSNLQAQLNFLKSQPAFFYFDITMITFIYNGQRIICLPK